MIDVKLIVLFVCIGTIFGKNNYCEICSHHTLCKYTMSGPAPSCKRYDKTSLLTKDDINEIVNRLNERRNFVAMGYSKLLPQAANMKKMMWSEELATFAQRWVDQCDESLQPDKEDQCRNMRNTEVGQNIASISGATSAFNVKSFVDIWFMQTIGYSGSVFYYNQTRDHRTNYFSQLIWADTNVVGCGRARFYINHTGTVIDRLVCNFAPKGNIHGKPVYAVGYPATQCPKNMRFDETFKGLCRYYANENGREFTPSRPRVSSLLRILNLSNSSVKQEIDPIRNNLKQMKSNANDTIEQRNQKTRHVLRNMQGKVKHVEPLPMPNFRDNSINISTNPELRLYQQERGHSRVYHGHDAQKNQHIQYANQGNNEQNFRRFKYATSAMTGYITEDSRKYFQSQRCTRRILEKDTLYDCATHTDINNKCTRGNQKKDCVQTTPLCDSTTSREQIPFNEHIYPHELCPCNTPKPTTRCMCNINCQCANYKMTTIYPHILRNQDDINTNEARKSAELHHYDFANIGTRSGETIKKNTSSDKKWHFSNPDSYYENEKTPRAYKGREYNEKRSNINFKNDYDDSIASHSFNKRKKRYLSDEITFKPFWQMDEITNKKPSQLKSLRYTTISNKKTKLTKKIPTTVKALTTTEPITIQLKEAGSSIRNSVTEKYLSFDELMHLRKLGISETVTGARRNANAATEPKLNFTANTPFVRKKHCTRKVTCTWTASSPTGADGSIIPGGGGPGGDIGSRTPPGYVDGCTRTSTCTRDYMDRNKWASSSDETSSDVTLEDEDYCEKRALNIQRRNSDDEFAEDNRNLYSNSHLHSMITTVYPNFINDKIQSFYQYDMTTTPPSDCICSDENDRIKRDNRNYNTKIYYRYRDRETIQEYQPEEHLSYGDLYYLVLQKIISAWKNNRSHRDDNKCMCNIGIEIKSCIMLIFYLIVFFLIVYL